MTSVDAILMLGPEGNSAVEQWVRGARDAAARDALRTLRSLPSVGRIIVATPDAAWGAHSAEFDFRLDLDPPDSPFHFGRRLAGLCEVHRVEKVFYLGGGSLPLLGLEQLAQAIEDVADATGPLAVTNNVHSSDWLATSTTAPFASLPHRLPRDNSLGWVLRTEAGVQVRGLPASAATRVDIDTPFDLLLLSLYPRLGPELARYLAAESMNEKAGRLRTAIQVLSTPGSQAAIIGRLASAAWAHLEAHTQVWLRVYSEERGMAASGRQDAGTVRSLVASYMEAVGAEVFFRELAGMAQAALVDTRLLLAHHRSWPSAADRYHSDLCEWEAIQDPWLREFTRAACEVSLPVVMGGHGVVAGGLYAIVDILNATARAA